MASITNTTITTHPLTQVTMSDGTVYDVAVSYLDQNGKPLSVCAFHENCQFEHSLALKDQLSSLLKAITETHANKSGIKSFRDIKVMTLTNNGITFDQTPLKSHDVDFDKSKTENFTQDAPTKELLSTCNTVVDIWNKTSKLILDDYNCHTQDSIEGHVDKATSADTATFTLKQAEQSSTIPIALDLHLDTQQPPQQSMLSKGREMVGNALSVLGSGLDVVANNLRHLHPQPNTPGFPLSDASSEIRSKPSWINTLTEPPATTRKATELSELARTFESNKDVAALINKTYDISMKDNTNFEIFIQDLTDQYKAIASHLNADLENRFKDETIKKLTNHFTNLVQETKKTTVSSWLPRLPWQSNPTELLKATYAKAEKATVDLLTSSLGRGWEHHERTALFKTLFS